MSSIGPFEHLPLANGDVAPVRIRVDGRAKRISLKVEKVGGLVTLTAPSEKQLPEARKFMSKRTGWIAARRASAHTITPFQVGERIPVFGQGRLIQHDPAAIDPVRVIKGNIIIGGAESALAETIQSFFKVEARRRLTAAAERYAARIDEIVEAVTVRDAKTRWGSCSSTGRLSFSWRLAMAPPGVLDYVAAHEVAHLRHMNHGPEFWALVAALDPNWEAAEAWLNNDGPSLRRYG